MDVQITNLQLLCDAVMSIWEKNLRGMFWNLRSDFVSFPLRFLLGYLLEYYDNNYVKIFNHLRPDE